MASKYQKIDLSQIDRKKIKQNHGIESSEKIKIYDEIKHVKELWTFPNGIKESGTNIRCHWDHHTFEGIGIFCPLTYRPKQVAKIGQNEVKIRGASQVVNNFMIKENIPRCKDILHHKNLIEITDAYYEVDGVFCSPECCLAFINDEKSKVGGSKYSDSQRLLHFMLGLTTCISPANHFRLLKEYGGNLTIEQFRNNNKSIKYEYCGTTVLISHLFEKKINLSTD
ncbi:hypothetical protein WIV_gp191 [Wiseana iridescent virus]|uniref:Uncharacterized protein n=1 Tax=Wiseana iridescent virus TaxID=68347 RepID=G0T5L7_IRV9|nr:hypothetical protein WIV_gp191 [Wiseana iridescent virus]ADO00535.1 hypothetical protein [Wiseana iridescent virus]